VSRTPWSELGFVRLRPSADPINRAYQFLAGNRALIPATLVSMVSAAGFGEETIFRGHLFERFGKLFGSSTVARTATVLITAIWFGVGHYSSQGLSGAEQATVFGLVFGTIFAIRRGIWLLMCAHAAFDLTAYAIIYWNLESDVAHLFFN
jgi:membrane protease YdiL (CAAX protease family)